MKKWSLGKDPSGVNGARKQNGSCLSIFLFEDKVDIGDKEVGLFDRKLQGDIQVA